MLVLTVLMYSLSTVHIALSFRQNEIAFFNQHAADGGLSILNDQGNPIVFVQIAVEVINVSAGIPFACLLVNRPHALLTLMISVFLAYVAASVQRFLSQLLISGRDRGLEGLGALG